MVRLKKIRLIILIIAFVLINSTFSDIFGLVNMTGYGKLLNFLGWIFLFIGCVLYSIGNKTDIIMKIIGIYSLIDIVFSLFFLNVNLSNHVYEIGIFRKLYYAFDNGSCLTKDEFIKKCVAGRELLNFLYDVSFQVYILFFVKLLNLKKEYVGNNHFEKIVKYYLIFLMIYTFVVVQLNYYKLTLVVGVIHDIGVFSVIIVQIFLIVEVWKFVQNKIKMEGLL